MKGRILTVKKILYLSLGHICVLLGIIGIILPLLPGTPFLILAAILYSKGSSKFHFWLVTHKYLGPPINRWNKTGAISKQTKGLAITLIIVNFICVVSITSIHWGLKTIVGTCCLTVIAYIASRPSM